VQIGSLRSSSLRISVMVRPVLCLGTSPRNLELKKFNLQEAWRPSEICLFLSVYLRIRLII